MAANLVTARRNGCVVKWGRAATSSSKDLYLVSQDNVIKKARQVTVWKARHWFEAGLCQYRLCMLFCMLYWR